MIQHADLEIQEQYLPTPTTLVYLTAHLPVTLPIDEHPANLDERQIFCATIAPRQNVIMVLNRNTP